jgi:hypothetical protein
MTETTAINQQRKEVLKTLIRALHSGGNAEELSQRFQQIIHGVNSTELAQIEEELIKEGMPREEVQRLCDLHISMFRESLEKEEAIAPPGHPINIQMEEHKILLRFAQELARLAQRAASAAPSDVARLAEIGAALRDSESHYVREENVLFPYLEKHGVTQPPAIMWMEHDQIRQIKKSVYGVLDARTGMAPAAFGEQLQAAAAALAEMLAGHFYKENKILFPTCLRVFEESEWPEVRREFDELGYCCFTPERPAIYGAAEETIAVGEEAAGLVRFGSGTLSLQEIEALFNTLPLDVTFVDANDRVRFFNDIPDRVFPRAKAVIGRQVQRCHPQKSVGVVTHILEEFRAGKRDAAEFWLELHGKFIHIRYFALRDRQRAYLGCLEVMQDVTAIRALRGEKRLLSE